MFRRHKEGFLLITFAFIGFIVWRGEVRNEEEFTWKKSPKLFIEKMRSQKIIDKDSIVLCNTILRYEKILFRYSDIYFSKDICTKYRYHTTEGIDPEFEYIIHASNSTPDAVFDEIVANYESILHEGEYSLLRKIHKK